MSKSCKMQKNILLEYEGSRRLYEHNQKTIKDPCYHVYNICRIKPLLGNVPRLIIVFGGVKTNIIYSTFNFFELISIRKPNLQIIMNFTYGVFKL